MSNQEMQFADPEWQPPMQGRSTGEQAPYTTVDIDDPPRQQTGGQTTARNEDKETGDTDYTRGYRAEQPGYQSAQAKSVHQPHRNGSPWFWVILMAIVIAILSFIPFGEDGIIVFWRVLMISIIATAGITALISVAIRLGRK